MLNKGVSLLAVAPSYVENRAALINTAPFSPVLWWDTHIASRPSHEATVTAHRDRAGGIPHLPINKTSSKLQCWKQGGSEHCYLQALCPIPEHTPPPNSLRSLS